MSKTPVLARMYSRASWGARYRAGFGSRTQNYPLPEMWTHHSVTAHLPATATVAEEKAQMRILENIGQQRFKGGISYSFVIFPSGRIYMGLGASRIGAHTGGRNSISVSTVFAGNYSNTRPTAAAEDTYAGLLQDLKTVGVLRSARTNGGHRDAPGNTWNACPGDGLHGRLGAINSKAAGGKISSSAPTKPATKPAEKPAPKPAPKQSSGSGPTTNPKTGTGVAGRFLQTRPGGTVNIRSSPDSRGSGNIVGTVRGGELVRRDSSRDTSHFYGVGDSWYVGKSVATPVRADGRNTLVIGDWPGRRMPLNGTNTFELNEAWRELLARVNIARGSRVAMIQRWLTQKNYNPGPVDGIAGKRTYRALQRYLNANVSQARLTVDGIRGAQTRIAEKRFLNGQIRYIGSKWPQHYRN